jgi:hypothetical protein
MDPDAGFAQRGPCGGSRRHFVATAALWPVSMLAAAQALPERRFQVSAFDGVQIEIPADVRIQPANSHTVVAKAEPGVLQALRIEVVAGLLKITAGGYQTRRPVELSIGYVDLNRILALTAGTVRLLGPSASRLHLVADGAASFSGEGLNVGTLLVDIPGAGSVKLAGKAKRQQISLSGTGEYLGFEVRSDDVVVNLSGAGDAEVSALVSLKVSLDGAGNVRYRGRAKVTRQGDGAGGVEMVGTVGL